MYSFTKTNEGGEVCMWEEEKVVLLRRMHKRITEGVCVKHGAKVRRCKHDGCTNQVINGGLCMRHGAKVNRCKHEGCTNIVQKGGLCKRHGEKVKKCSHKQGPE